MRRENYLFPGYALVQDDAYFKLSQDSVLLGGFLRAGRARRLLDLGCGVGPLMLIALLRSPGLRAVGVELLPGAAELARENLARNGVAARAEVLTGDMRALDRSLWDAFDLCVSNPPYFDPTRGAVSPSSAMAAARDGSEGDIFDVCAAASRALQNGGRFCVCYPPELLAELFRALERAGLEPKILRLVHPDRDRAPCLALLECKKGGGVGLRVQPPLLIRENGAETEEFLRNYRLEGPGS